MSVYLAFALKLLVVVACARILRRRWPDDLGALLAAWTLVTALSFAVMLALSGMNSLTRPSLWIALAAGATIAAISMRRGLALPSFFREARIPLALFGIFWLIFALRAALFQDFTWDAQTYGLARIGLWMNYETLFIHMPTPLTNVFANEWNGELLGMFYALAAGDLQGPIFANAEVLAVTFLACAWLGRLLGASWNWAFVVAGVAALCPACLGLAATVKGDLLAVAAFVMATGWLLILKGGQTRFAAGMFLGCLALAVGAKITAAIAVLVLGATALVLAPPRIWISQRTLLVGGALAALFMSRYVANTFAFGTPLNRPQEGAEPGIATFLRNIRMIWERSREFAAHDPDGPELANALMGGLGLTGLAVLCAIAWLVARRRRVPLLLLGAFLIGIAASCYLVPARVWGFRYFLPALVAAAVILLAMAESRHRRLAAAAALIVTAVNVSYLAWPGELNGNDSIVRAVRELIGKSAIERTFLPSSGRGTTLRFDELRFDRAEPLRFVVFQRGDGAILPFIGSRAQNRVVLAASPENVPALLRQHRPDFAVILKRSEFRLPKALRDAVIQAEFVWIDENQAVAIAVRSDRPEARLTLKGPALSLPDAPEKAPTWRTGAYGLERSDDFAFRWVQNVVEVDVPLSDGEACLALSVFAATRSETPQVVRIEGGNVDPASFDLAGTDIRSRKRAWLRIRGAGPSARLRLIATMPVTRWPNDYRAIAFGIAVPARIVPMSDCR